MPSEFKEWKEKEWQTHINAILTVHHHCDGQTYHSVADKVQGDGGLEGFSSNGHGYQCYCDQGSVSTADRTRKQKEKITEDLKKLETNQAFWEAMFQGIKLKRWVLVVPVYEDKAVLKHARERAAELKKKKLPFLHSAFQADVCTDKDGFPIAYQKVVEGGATRINVSPGSVDVTTVQAFVQQEPVFVQNMDRKTKLAAAKNPAASPVNLRNQLLSYYLKGSNILKSLEQDVPAVHEKIVTFTSEQTDSISIESQVLGDEAGPRLTATRKELSKSLASIATSLDETTINILAWCTVAGWLGECPLDFSEPMP